MNVTDLRRNLRNAGALRAGLDVGYRLTNKFTTFKILKTLNLTPRLLNPSTQNGNGEFQHLFLDETQLRFYAREPVNEMTNSFLDEALAKGDRCSAILLGKRLVNYVWCARRATPLTHDLLFEFGSEWLYRYNAFTLPAYRGRRLQGWNTTMALQEAVKLGLKGFICYADVNNYSSLKSMYRCGYVDVGKMFMLRMSRTYWIHVDPECRPYGLNLKPL